MSQAPDPEPYIPPWASCKAQMTTHNIDNNAEQQWCVTATEDDQLEVSPFTIDNNEAANYSHEHKVLLEQWWRWTDGWVINGWIDGCTSFNLNLIQLYFLGHGARKH